MRIKNRLAAMAAVGAVALTLAACGGSSEPETPTGEETETSDDATTDEETSDPGDQTATTLKLALNQTEEHPSFVALEAFGEDLSAATDGRWDVEVYPNSTLGDQSEYLQSVSEGVIELAIVSAPQLENLYKDFVIFSLPTVFDDIDHQMSVLADEAIVGDLYASLEESNNISVIGGFTQGARSIYTKSGVVETPADLAGQKIRVQESPVFISMINALGASPTPMAYSEVYTGLQSGVIDGAENNEISYFTQKHFEVAPYYSYTNHLIGADFLIANTDTLASMSAEDRAAFDTAWEAAWTAHTELWITQTAEAVAGAEAGGATFADVDSAAFVEALTPLLDEFLTTDDQKALYDAIRAAAD